MSDQCGNQDDVVRASALVKDGRDARAAGDYQRMRDSFTAALGIYRKIGDRSGQATTVHNIASAQRALGRVEDALTGYKAALTIYEEMGDRSGQATTLNNIASAQRDPGLRQTVKMVVASRSGSDLPSNWPP